MSRFVRSSKFRHVFGKAAKNPDGCYLGIRLSSTAWDSNFIAVNGKFIAVCWKTGGGGAVGVITQDQTGKLGEVPLIAGHKGTVLDIAWNPFNDNILATGSEDCKIKIWNVPDSGLPEDGLGQDDAVQNLSGHGRKVGTVGFNPVANNILATSSTDYSIKTWDIEKGQAACDISGAATNIIQCVDWNHNGSLLASVSKDKKIRIFDPRKNSKVAEASGHQGVKGARCVWTGEKGYIFSVGFGRGSQRQYALWDPKKFDKPVVGFQQIDSASGILMPFYDNDTNCVFVAGKGDGNIRFYEITGEDKLLYSLSEFKSAQPARGMAMLPKREVNVNENEIVRLYKLHETWIEPIHFTVPRKSDLFQEDIFPDCASDEPALSADEWLGGKNSNPKTQSMAPGFTKKVVKKEFKPVKQVDPVEEMGETELRAEVKKLKKRVGYLEAEIVKRDVKIKELGGDPSSL